jgi:hypothetical protein
MSMADALTEWRNKALELATAYTCAAIDKVTLWDICQSQEKPGLEQVERDAWTALVAHINGSPTDAPADESCPGCKGSEFPGWKRGYPCPVCRPASMDPQRQRERAAAEGVPPSHAPSVDDLMKLVGEYGVCRYTEGLHAMSCDPNLPLDPTISENSRTAYEKVRAALGVGGRHGS